MPQPAARRKFWGWGLEGEGLTVSEIEQLGSTFAGRFGIDGVRVQEPPRVDELDLRAPRLAPPASLEAPDVGGGYHGAVSVDLRHLQGVLDVDRTSRAAQIAGGTLGPALEAQLKPHGLTLRHFPQSFEWSTLGGWIATRSGGHFANIPASTADISGGGDAAFPPRPEGRGLHAAILMRSSSRLRRRSWRSAARSPITTRWGVTIAGGTCARCRSYSPARLAARRLSSTPPES